MRYSLPLTGIAAGVLLATTVQANEPLNVEIHKVSADGVEESIGTVAVEHTEHGVLLTPSLTGLEPGVYGFHVHQNASCEPAENDSGEMTAALSAGGHYDPEEAGTHQGPYGDGHLGDLPVLTANDEPGRSIMIHAGGDTYADEPHLGGGGARMACGVVSS